MSDKITLEFPDGTRIKTTTNSQTSKYEDYYHKGKFYNVDDPRVKVVKDKDERG